MHGLSALVVSCAVCLYVVGTSHFVAVPSYGKQIDRDCHIQIIRILIGVNTCQLLEKALCTIYNVYNQEGTAKPSNQEYIPENPPLSSS